MNHEPDHLSFFRGLIFSVSASVGTVALLVVAFAR
jgi:hypothetical protein